MEQELGKSTKLLEAVPLSSLIIGDASLHPSSTVSITVMEDSQLLEFVNAEGFAPSDVLSSNEIEVNLDEFHQGREESHSQPQLLKTEEDCMEHMEEQREIESIALAVKSKKRAASRKLRHIWEPETSSSHPFSGAVENIEEIKPENEERDINEILSSVEVEYYPPFPDDRCANCFAAFENSTKTSVITLIPAAETGKEPVEEEIVQVLHEVFQLGPIVIPLPYNIFMCKSCSEILCTLYSALKKFKSLMHEESYVTSEINKLRKFKGQYRRRKRKDSQSAYLKVAYASEQEVKELIGEDEDDEKVVNGGDQSEDEDFQASNDELITAELTSSSSDDDDDDNVQTKKRKCKLKVDQEQEDEEDHEAKRSDDDELVSFRGKNRKKHGKPPQHRYRMHSLLGDGNEKEMDCTDGAENKAQRKKRKSRFVENCEVCGKTFVRPDHLRNHMRTHTGEKPFVCKICGKGFTELRGLSYHEVTHSDDRPYCCTVCGATFKRLHHLNDHEKNHRDDVERPFGCHCGKTFKQKKHLNTHMLSHVNTKANICDLCGKAFNRKDNLRQHIRKVHGKNPEFIKVQKIEQIEESIEEEQDHNIPSVLTQTMVPLDAVNLGHIVYMDL